MEFPKKRKVGREGQAFNKDWMLKYFLQRLPIKQYVCCVVKVLLSWKSTTLVLIVWQNMQTMAII